MTETRCGRCGRRVIIARSEDGSRTVELDPSAPVYLTADVRGRALGWRINGAKVEPTADGSIFLASHTMTCRHTPRRVAAPSSPSSCRGCGAQVVWIELPTLKRLPLDAVAAVYRMREVDGVPTAWRANGPNAPRLADGGTYLVTHFSTCPRASEFSKARRIS